MCPLFFLGEFTVKVLFLTDVYYNGALAHKKNELVDLDDSLGYATRWVKRGLAKEIIVELNKEPLKEVEIIEEVQVEMVFDEPIVKSVETSSELNETKEVSKPFVRRKK